GGDTGSALNRLILTSVGSQTPEADVFYGLDNTFLSRALDQDLFKAYQPASLDVIPAEFKLDPSFKVTPVDYGDVCINYDKAWFSENNIELPGSLQDLAKPEYSGLLVVENPATSSPGLAFMMATIAEFGENAWLDWWRAMKNNNVAIVSDWETAYYTNFSGSSGKGPQPMVVSYASSPAAELIYAETELSESPTASLVSPGMCWRQVEFAGILQNTPNRELAQKFVDFLLSREFQEDVPMQMFVFPVLPEAVLPEDFVIASQIPEIVASLDPDLISANRDAWVNDWTNLMFK
ncbi:MAG: thiamine ABC transporter substrate-binding protein, partial [Chloroflexi bacterium]|nr:thiamine ABC transporter substrate-binding protein [Chloroflexota bacterium]